MKHYIKLLTSVLLALMVALNLTACESSLKKPTGLEGAASKQEEKVEKEKKTKQKEQDEQEEKVKQEEVKGQAEEAEQAKIEEAATAANEMPVVEEQAQSAPTESEPAHSNVQEEQLTPNSDENSSGNSDNSSSNAQSVPQVSEQHAALPPTSPQVEKPVEQPIEAEPAKSTVTYSIVIASGEVPLPPTEVEIADGDTVLEALINITQKHGVQMDFRGGRGSGAYVNGMSNVYEFDRGQGSGWMFRVNGVLPDRGAGAIPLQSGDRVEWLYTTDMGKDL